MQDILEWGLEVVAAAQQFRTPWLDMLFIYVSSLGDNSFYLLIVPFLFWCVDKRIASKLIILYCLSNWINSELKELFQQPRPFDLDHSLKITGTGGYGLPSGHAQGSLVFWGFLARWKNKKWLYSSAVLFILLIAFSRVYLGAHFPTDILGGWLIGLTILFVYFISSRKIEDLFLKLKLTGQIFLSFAAPVLLALIAPTRWSVAPMAILSGFAAGYSIERIYIGFEPAWNAVHKIFRYISGMTVAGVIYYCLKTISLPEGEAYYLVLFYARFWVIGLFLSLGAPWLFKKLNI